MVEICLTSKLERIKVGRVLSKSMSRDGTPTIAVAKGSPMPACPDKDEALLRQFVDHLKLRSEAPVLSVLRGFRASTGSSIRSLWMAAIALTPGSGS